MTKSLGAFLLFLAAAEDGLDLDADITGKYGIASPKPYTVTTRMMMGMVLGGDTNPGEIWRYDETGDMWLHLLPKIIHNATGHPASYYWSRLHTMLGLSDKFTWPLVNSQWYRGAGGTCRDWARFGQFILNKGMWGDKQIIPSSFFDQMSQPLKYLPYDTYSNPCYGLLVWINADKSKHKGCCWEASRLPSPRCNDETFLDGAVHDMTLIIGLYGQVVMTLPSVNTVVVGFGNDLRPIEPVRIGYYPALCKVLGIPCNKVPELPKGVCDETIQCDGIVAQCYSGGGWNHSEPMPGGDQCMACFQQKMPLYFTKFPEAKPMLQNNCPHGYEAEQKFMECFCHGPKKSGGEVSNPFGRWPTTTTTTPTPVPCPPWPRQPKPPSPPPPSPCLFSPSCVNMLNQKGCHRNIDDTHGETCYKCMYNHQDAWKKAGCPPFHIGKYPDIHPNKSLADDAFCWCGPFRSGRRRRTALQLV